MLELYIANKTYSSWSLRPWILLRQLGIPFQEHLVYLDASSNWQGFRRFSPTGKVPCLINTSSTTGAGETVWDSLGITEFLADRYPNVWPSHSAARTWARCASAEMHSGFTTLREQCSMNCAIEVKLNAIDAALQKDIDRIEELWREGLQKFGGPFLGGADFSAVDAFFCPIAFRVQTYGLILNSTASAYAQRLLELPAMREWASAALEESSTEPDHEAACLKYGTLIHDKRRR